jgi:hypothetical protein
MAKKWTTTRSEGSVTHVSEGGFIAREGTPEHMHHEFYKNYNPQAVTSWHRGSPAELIETLRKRRQEEE